MGTIQERMSAIVDELAAELGTDIVGEVRPVTEPVVAHVRVSSASRPATIVDWLCIGESFILNLERRTQLDSLDDRIFMLDEDEMIDAGLSWSKEELRDIAIGGVMIVKESWIPFSSRTLLPRRNPIRKGSRVLASWQGWV